MAFFKRQEALDLLQEKEARLAELTLQQSRWFETRLTICRS